MGPKKKTEKPVKASAKISSSAAAEEAEESLADMLRKDGIVTTFALNSKKIHRNVRDINVTNLTVTFHGSPIIEEAELTLNYGNRYGFLGRNGSGKSTFMKVIAARAFPIPDGIDIFHLHEEIEASDMTAKEAVMSVDRERSKLEAEAEELNDIMTAEEGSEEADLALERLTQVYERLEELDATTAEARASKILDGLGFTPEKQNKATREFSGGWRMRIALARALFIQPTLLLLDEPTNHLDMEAVVWLEDYLSKWKKILFLVSHSQDFLNNVCTHIVNLSRKKLMYYSGNYDQFVKTKDEKDEEQEKRYKAEQDQIKHMKNYVARFGQGNAKMAKQAQSKEKTLEKMLRSGLTDKVEHEKALDFKFPDPAPLSPPVLQCNDITFGYPGREILYRNVDFGVDLDSRVALVGPNGAGKSTLLKIMTGDLIPLTGSVRPHPHLRISKFSQHFVDVLDLTVSPLDYFMALWTDLTREDCRKFLGRFGISGFVQTQIMSQLSDGQKSRVVLAKMAKEMPHLLLLDEPTNHLDMESIDSLAKAINLYTGGLVLVSHDMRLISQVAKEIWLCDNNTVSKFVGEIADFKMQLRKQILASNELGQASTSKKTVDKMMLAPLVPKKMLVSEGGMVPLDMKIAPPAPPTYHTGNTGNSSGSAFPPLPSSSTGSTKSSGKVNTGKPSTTTTTSTTTTSTTAATISVEEEEEDTTTTTPFPATTSGEGEEEDEETRRKAEEKAAAKARKRAEKEAAAALAQKEEEERIRRREEKLKESEEAKKFKELQAKFREEQETLKQRKETARLAEEAAALEAVQAEEEARRVRRQMKKREKALQRFLAEQQRREDFALAVRQDEWSQTQQGQLEEALLLYPSTMDKYDRWTSIAKCIGGEEGGKTKQQCLARYKFLKEFVAAQRHLLPEAVIAVSGASTATANASA